MNYSKLAEESSKLHEAFRHVGWCDEWAYELTKTCVREFPIFREMIEEERTPERIIGYVHFANGTKESIHNKDIDKGTGRTIVYTENNLYSISTETVYDYHSYIPTEKKVYYILDKDNSWQSYTYAIDHIDFI